jgi:hypothetical protein
MDAHSASLSAAFSVEHQRVFSAVNLLSEGRPASTAATDFTSNPEPKISKVSSG